MTIKNKKDLSSSIEQLEKAINKQETILKKFDNEQLVLLFLFLESTNFLIS